MQWALGEGKALEIVGQGSKRAIGRPAQSDLTLDLSGLTGVTLYEPEELVLSARAGTPIAEIEALVAANGQQLAFEPMDYGPLLGGDAGRGTIGGVLAANLSGPRRIKAGAARDHFLGFSAVSGRGETFKSGGRVVKNVTGYDLCKLMAGSWGTLAAMTEVTIKVLPRPETETTVIVRGLDDAAAIGPWRPPWALPCDVSGAAHLPAAVGDGHWRLRGGAALTALRLEGVAPSVAHRKAVLQKADAGPSARSSLRARRSRAICGGRSATWRRSRRAARRRRSAALAHLDGAGQGAAAGARHRRRRRRRDASTTGPAACLGCCSPMPTTPGARWCARAVKACGGHATLIRAPAALRAAIDVFEPQDAALAALTKRVKDSFDPQGVLNPGRMWAGS